MKDEASENVFPLLEKRNIALTSDLNISATGCPGELRLPVHLLHRSGVAAAGRLASHGDPSSDICSEKPALT